MPVKWGYSTIALLLAETFVQIYSIESHIVTLLLSFLGVFFISVIHFIIFMMYTVSLFPKFFHANCKHIFIYLCLALYIFMTVLQLRYIWLYSVLVKLSGDIEENPGPKPKPSKSFSICPWNVSSVSAHNLIKSPF